jgi:acyl carrier protein
VSDFVNRVRELVAEIWQLDEEEVVLTTNFERLGIDSMEMIDFVMTLEERFEIEVPDDEGGRWETVGDVVDWLEERSKV